MADPKAVLIFNKNSGERKSLARLMKMKDNRVFDTEDGLEALQILQKENIGVILAGGDISGVSRQEFKDLVEKLRPGTNTIFTSPFSEADKKFSLSTDECAGLIHDYLRNEGAHSREMSELKNFSFSIADRLLQIFAVNDKYFFNNDHLVAELSGKIAARMGLEEDLVESVRMAALLRDLGRVVIHQQILQENKRLTGSELTPIKAHPIHTMQILRQVRFPWNLDSMISQHHEHYDGNGYPMGLKGREISVGARIINVVDAYYAMTTDRPYRKALPRDRAIAEIKKTAGGQFDPEVVEVFLALTEEEAAELSGKKNVLIFEKEPQVAPMIRLNTAADAMNIMHVASSLEAFSRIRQKNPQLVIVDLDSVDPEVFMRFYTTARQTADAARRDFLLIVPDRNYLNHFNGDLGDNVDYLVKPLNLEQLLYKIRKLPFEAPRSVSKEEAAGGLTGNIEDFNLADIIQILSLGLKTARIEVVRETDRGALYLLHGKPVHASAGNIEGREAFFELMQWEKGKFYITHGVLTEDVNITCDLMQLLLEAADAVSGKKSALPPAGKNLSGSVA
jgi:HD-GYP domain-containing protein (c-di-GMP phosphodiesterase class II)/CheY-like chemotaxis protein